MLLRRTRIAALIGSSIGVTVGCLIGMFPLLLMPNPAVVEAVKRKEKVIKRHNGGFRIAKNAKFEKRNISLHSGCAFCFLAIRNREKKKSCVALQKKNLKIS